jgi:hypothetical protein
MLIFSRNYFTRWTVMRIERRSCADNVSVFGGFAPFAFPRLLPDGHFERMQRRAQAEPALCYNSAIRSHFLPVRVSAAPVLRNIR